MLVRKYMRNFVSLVLAISLLFPSVVLAADDDSVGFDETFYSGNNILFFNPTQTCGASSRPVVNSAVSGTAEENLRTILEYFTNKGLTLAAASGIAANIKAESSFEPAAIQGSPPKKAPAAKKGADGKIDTATIYKPVDKVGFGLSQWTYGGVFLPRQGPLYNSAVRLKTDIIDMGLQLDYIWKELNSGYKASTLDRIASLTDPREATKIYMVNYEAPKDQSQTAQNNRADIGEEIYNQYKGQISDGSGATLSSYTDVGATGDTCEVLDDGSGGVGVADGFTFPLKTTQYKLKNGIEGAVWCYAKNTNCHHDYNAADIFVETGTPILAAKAGKVVGKTSDSCDYYGCNVSVMGEDGILYYYTHMSRHAIVQVGEEVQAGQQLGSVGTNSTAMNTPRHLHFDMLPGDKYTSRPGCSSAACTSYPFINVQQYLVPAYNALPSGAA